MHPKARPFAQTQGLSNSIGKDRPDFNYFVKIYLWLPIQKNRPGDRQAWSLALKWAVCTFCAELNRTALRLGAVLPGLAAGRGI